MEPKRVGVQRFFSGLIACSAWAAVIVQFYLMVGNRIAPVGETVVRFFSYFTILTNILVAYCFSTHVFKSPARGDNFFSRPSVLTSVTAYIVFVAIVYHLLLRQIWDPRGLQLIVDELLHTVVPIFCLLFWIVFVPKVDLHWKNTLAWLIYPIIYQLYIMARGALTSDYPYPFINAADLGWAKATWNSVTLMIAFLLLSLLLVAISKATSGPSAKIPSS
jgi:hypothetical protein